MHKLDELQTTRPKDNSPQDNSPHIKLALRQLAPNSYDNSPHIYKTTRLRFILQLALDPRVGGVGSFQELHLFHDK